MPNWLFVYYSGTKIVDIWTIFFQFSLVDIFFYDRNYPKMNEKLELYKLSYFEISDVLSYFIDENMEKAQIFRDNEKLSRFCWLGIMSNGLSNPQYKIW